MIIACDMDSVLNNLTEKMLEVYNSQSGKNIQIEDLTAYNFYDCLSKEDADGLIKSFKNIIILTSKAWDGERKSKFQHFL